LQTNCDNIASKKILIIAKKKSNPLVQIIIASYYRIALSLCNKYRKMSSMRLPSLLPTTSATSILSFESSGKIHYCSGKCWFVRL